MKFEVVQTYSKVPFLYLFFVYLFELILFLVESISGSTFVLLLFLNFTFLLVFIFAIWRTSLSKLAFILPTLLSAVLFIYELPLIVLDDYHFSISAYDEPEELISGTGIFTLSVKVYHVDHVENELAYQNSVTTQDEIYNVIPITNLIRYRSKNSEILEMLGIYKDRFKKMPEIVNAYLKTSNPSFDEYFAREKSYGDSSGLSLVLSSLISQGKFENNRSIAVTGAIDKTGKVRKVGYINEKVQIANEFGLPYIIMPTENITEAKKIKQSLNLPIEIIGVRNVNEAILRVKELNNSE